MNASKLIEGKRVYFWLALAGAATYIRTLFFGFSYFDDNVLILNNLFFLKNLGNIFTTFTTEVFHILHASAAYYRPILTLSFMIDAQIAGESPLFYHLTNVLIHIAASCFVYLFLFKLSKKKVISFLFSLLFVVHPVFAQATAWVPGRNDSLLALFFLASFIFFIDFLESKNIKYYLAHILFFAISIFTKESAVFLPVTIVFYVLLLSPKAKNMSDLFFYAFGWGMVYLTWFLLRTIALVNPISYSLFDIIKTLVNNSPAVLVYLGKLFFPFNLSVLPTLADSTLVYGIVAFGLMVLLFVWRKVGTRWLIFGVVWFLMYLFPSFIRPNTSYMPDFLEHRVYLPSIGLMIIFTQMIGSIRKVHLAAFGLIFAVFFVIDQIHLGNFSDKLTFWKSAAATSPSHPLAHKNLGAMYYLDGDLDGAEVEYKKSLELNPAESMVHNNLGLIYANRNDFAQAEIEYKKELEINPGYDDVHFNYGILKYRQGDSRGAEQMWLATLALNPDYVDAMKSLVYYYTQEKESQKAAYYISELAKRGIQSF